MQQVLYYSEFKDPAVDWVFTFLSAALGCAFHPATEPHQASIMYSAAKDGLLVERITDYDVVKKLVLKTFDRKNKVINMNLLEKILSSFANASNSFAFAAMNNGQPVSAVFTIREQPIIYSAAMTLRPSMGAGTLCMWQSILHAKGVGLNTFDFEGSMLPEVERFFRGFGADLVPYFTVNKAWLPLEFMLKIFKRERF